MFFRQFIYSALYKPSCVLFSCLFFVSCNTVSKKPTEVVSAAGSRNIASAAMASINASAFLVMQDCPVLASIQSRIRVGEYGGEQIMNMMQEKDSQGRSLTQRLLLESASSDCSNSLDAFKQNLCSNNVHDDLCESLNQLKGAKPETIAQEFEEFVGTPLRSFNFPEMLDKIKEFSRSRRDGTASSSSSWFSRAVATTLDYAHIAGTGLWLFGSYAAGHAYHVAETVEKKVNDEEYQHKLNDALFALGALSSSSNMMFYMMMY